MPIDVIMPQLGESIAEGTIVKWLVRAGGRVEKDQPLLEVETDKVTLEIPSPTSGVVGEVLVSDGETVPVGALLARLDPEPRPEADVVNRVGGVVVRHQSPAVFHLAKEQGVDLSQVKGTGADGRVTKKDVLAFVEARRTAGRAAAPAQPAEDQVLPVTPMRGAIAERMVKSQQTAAHVATVFESDFSGIAAFRQGRPLTFLPFVIHAVARALAEMPILNASWEERGIVLRRHIHIGIAVALDDGLLVPVIRDADRKGLSLLSEEVADLAARARSKRLNPEEVRGGTFTITNHGGSGSLFSTPIIQQPQIAILGVGAVHKRPVVINEAIAIRPMGYLSLSFDHRAIDGATADRFMTVVKQRLERSEWEKCL